MISVEEAINNFYKEKSKYESLLDKDKKSIIKNKGLSWKEKRVEYNKLKPKCVNCKRPVGSIFSVTHDNSNMQEIRILRATCGDRVNPCNFNININPGSYSNIVAVLKKEELDLKKYKMKIIDEKNKLLFGYVSTEDAINKFDEFKNEIKSSSELLGHYYDEYNLVFDNEEKKMTLKQLISSSYLFINEIKDAIKNFEKTKNTQYCQDAVTMYVKQLKPVLNQILGLKYSASFVDYDTKTGIYSLIQQKHTIKNTESMEVEPQVITYEKGIETSSQSKTKKARDEPSSKKNVTKKKKIVIEEDSEPEIEDEDVNEDVNQGEEAYVYAPNSPVYAPDSPVYAPNSPVYAPNSPLDDNQQENQSDNDLEEEEP